VVAALDVPGIKKVLPESFRKYPMFDNIYNLECVPIATVQVSFDGWVTEMNNDSLMMDVSGDQSDGRNAGIDNLLCSADAEISCFAKLASPGEYTVREKEVPFRRYSTNAPFHDQTIRSDTIASINSTSSFLPQRNSIVRYGW